MRKQKLGTGRIEQSKRHRPRIGGPPPRRIEPAEMSHSRYTLTSIHENFADPAIDSEDTTESECSGQCDQSGGGQGEHRGGGEAGATDDIDDINDIVSAHAACLEQLRNIHKIAQTDLRGPIGEQLSMVVTRMANGLRKRMDRSNKAKPELRRHIRALLDNEAGYFVRRQQEHADWMNQKRQKIEAKEKVKEANQKLKEIAQQKEGAR